MASGILTVDHIRNGDVAACTLPPGATQSVPAPQAGEAAPPPPASAESPDETAELLQDCLFALTSLPDDAFFELGRGLPRSLVRRSLAWMDRTNPRPDR